jgi:NAD(P) transhydrogenase subunit alpha
MVRENLSRLSGLMVLCTVLIATASLWPGEPVGAESVGAAAVVVQETAPAEVSQAAEHAAPETDFWSLLFVFLLASFIGLGVIRRVSRLLHTPLMSLTNAISAIAVVGSIIVTGSDYPTSIRIMGVIAVFASVTNIVSGFLITDRMLKMFKTTKQGGEA